MLTTRQKTALNEWLSSLTFKKSFPVAKYPQQRCLLSSEKNLSVVFPPHKSQFVNTHTGWPIPSPSFNSFQLIYSIHLYIVLVSVTSQTFISQCSRCSPTREVFIPLLFLSIFRQFAWRRANFNSTSVTHSSLVSPRNFL